MKCLGCVCILNKKKIQPLKFYEGRERIRDCHCAWLGEGKHGKRKAQMDLCEEGGGGGKINKWHTWTRRSSRACSSEGEAINYILNGLFPPFNSNAPSTRIYVHKHTREGHKLIKLFTRQLFLRASLIMIKSNLLINVMSIIERNYRKILWQEIDFSSNNSINYNFITRQAASAARRCLFSN